MKCDLTYKMTHVRLITDDSDEVNHHLVCITQNPYCWLTGWPRLQTTDSSLAKSSPASTMVLLDVRLLPGARRHIAPTSSGSFIAATSFRKSFTLAHGVDKKPKGAAPHGIHSHNAVSTASQVGVTEYQHRLKEQNIILKRRSKIFHKLLCS